jgi:hypothetical protein
MFWSKEPPPQSRVIGKRGDIGVIAGSPVSVPSAHYTQPVEQMQALLAYFLQI